MRPDKDEQKISVQKIVLHPHFHDYTFDSDIALLYLSRPVTLGPFSSRPRVSAGRRSGRSSAEARGAGSGVWMGSHGLPAALLSLPEEGAAAGGRSDELHQLHRARHHRQHVLCRIPAGGDGRLHGGQRRALRSQLQGHLVPGRRGELGREMCRRGQIRRLHQTGKLLTLDTPGDDERGIGTEPEPEPEPIHY